MISQTFLCVCVLCCTFAHHQLWSILNKLCMSQRSCTFLTSRVPRHRTSCELFCFWLQLPNKNTKSQKDVWDQRSLLVKNAPLCFAPKFTKSWQRLKETKLVLPNETKPQRCVRSRGTYDVRNERLCLVSKICRGLGAIVAARGCNNKNNKQKRKKKRKVLRSAIWDTRNLCLAIKTCRRLTAVVPEWSRATNTQKRQALCEDVKFTIREMCNWFGVQNLFRVCRVGGTRLYQNRQSAKGALAHWIHEVRNTNYHLVSNSCWGLTTIDTHRFYDGNRGISEVRKKWATSFGVQSLLRVGSECGVTELQQDHYTKAQKVRSSSDIHEVLVRNKQPLSWHPKAVEGWPRLMLHDVTTEHT